MNLATVYWYRDGFKFGQGSGSDFDGALKIAGNQYCESALVSMRIRINNTAGTCSCYHGLYGTGCIFQEAFLEKYRYLPTGIRICKTKPLCNTSGLWPRVRARALRAPVFLGS